ncbi:hypothetical protein [Cohnella thailandensis]|uniref:Sporulation membrane protein YtrI C-terminal domain-containing protein n=1 Tax=Cohnella thailandensis TaxID=557557 RepID=A0A841T212_9BACL|nr:hypothetical protein [Cohnella thailandensis]MBB6635917.1 hypothetical protein [Cohnella thailandensis]MBP1976295.1 hypothetical protein [Cohnella thailandensis]
MRVPDFKRYRKGMHSMAFFLCGMIVGAAIFNSMVADQSHRIIEQNYDLKEQLTLTEAQLKANKQVTKIREIVAFVLEPEGKPPVDKVAEAELKKKVEKDLSILIGNSIYDIGSDAELVRKLINGKVYTDVKSKNYSVSIRTMLLADSVLQVWVEAKQVLTK